MTEEKSGTSADTPKVIMLPPMLVLHHVVAGLVLNWALGMRMGHAWGWIGLVLLAAAYGLTVWARKKFQSAGTNVPPNLPSLAIVTGGPYEYTRNPMYMAFLLGFAGMALLANAPAMLLLLLPLWYILDRHVIQPEETYLRDKFGDTYRDYTLRVRRWV